MCTTTIEDIISRSGWDGIDAITNDEIHTINDDLMSRPGPRMVDALEQLAEIFHPELFS
jgi:iron complex transport system substrate-binding protein